MAASLSLRTLALFACCGCYTLACATPQRAREPAPSSTSPSSSPDRSSGASNPSSARSTSRQPPAASNPGRSAPAGAAPAAGEAAANPDGVDSASRASAAAPSRSAALAPVLDPQNHVEPVPPGEELAERARHLFEAVVRGEPALADDAFFPREPFLPLKAVADAGRYFDELIAQYHRDVQALHGGRRSWETARFVAFELGTTPRWVAPGEEWNAIGYYRSFHGKLRYAIDGKPRSFDVHTLISWQGRWYITHLLPFKH